MAIWIATIDEAGFHAVVSASELDFPAVMSAWPSSSLADDSSMRRKAQVSLSVVRRTAGGGQAKTALQAANFVRLRDGVLMQASPKRITKSRFFATWSTADECQET
jgi:hypothetical protein